MGKLPVSRKIAVSVGLEYLNGRYTEKGEFSFWGGQYTLERGNHFFRAPLRVHYRLFKPSEEGFRVSPEVGIVPQYFSRTRFSEPFSSSSDEFFRKFGLSIDAGIGIQKPLSEAVTVEFVPYFSYSLTDYGLQDESFFKNELDSFIPFFAGLQLRVGWILP